MNKITKIIGSLCLILFAQTSIACDYPDRISLPNGATAAKEDMLAAQKQVKAFVSSMEVYMECIVEEEKLARLVMGNLSSKVEAQREEMLNKKYNAAVDEMETVAANFNSEVQDYKKRDD